MNSQRKDLHHMIDSIPAQNLEHAKLYLEFLLTHHQQVLPTEQAFDPTTYFGVSHIPDVDEQLQKMRNDWESDPTT